MNRLSGKIDSKTETRPIQLGSISNFTWMLLGVLRGYPHSINTQKPSKTQTISKSIKEVGIFSKFLPRLDFNDRDESCQFTW
jgi:hypothetical protein